MSAIYSSSCFLQLKAFYSSAVQINFTTFCIPSHKGEIQKELKIVQNMRYNPIITKNQSSQKLAVKANISIRIIYLRPDFLMPAPSN